MTQITDERRFTRPSQTTTTVTADAVEHAIRHTTLRALGFGGMLAIALIHLLDVIGKIKETPYLGVMYIALMVASVVVAFYLLHTGSTLAWAAAGLLAAATLDGLRPEPHDRPAERLGRHRQLDRAARARVDVRRGSGGHPRGLRLEPRAPRAPPRRARVGRAAGQRRALTAAAVRAGSMSDPCRRRAAST